MEKPFWGNWQEVKEELVDFESIHKDYKNYYFIKLLMSSDYFDFANKPKGILPFIITELI
jgi:hypothetical protein